MSVWESVPKINKFLLLQGCRPEFGGFPILLVQPGYVCPKKHHSQDASFLPSAHNLTTAGFVGKKPWSLPSICAVCIAYKIYRNTFQVLGYYKKAHNWIQPISKEWVSPRPVHLKSKKKQPWIKTSKKTQNAREKPSPNLQAPPFQGRPGQVQMQASMSSLQAGAEQKGGRIQNNKEL